jgi:ubiquinone/menaquinone biosynthesis C-methylase UbiE
MRRLAQARELLDGATLDPVVLDGNLRDLTRINRRLGGADLSIRAIRSLVGEGSGGTDLRVLDVGTGAADIPLAMVAAPGPWRSLRVTAVDSRWEILDAARRATPGLTDSSTVELRLADGRALPFADGAYDVGHASLVLHHLEPEDAVTFLRELRRVSRLGVVVNDLARGRLPLLGAWLVLRLMTRNAYTVHDGVLSVRRAWTSSEARALLREAGLEAIAEHHGLARHRWSIAAVAR